ncbi:unnamed protein product [Peronospora belbahrii]|uniref:Srp40 C-terminal domain-containing protein n=1 Tax=Peronospora belbahrii TaxID=622444 RepID=A0AAU9L6G5_9STRA|nr:unnamed protein product [Peronospora belbahrii]
MVVPSDVYPLIHALLTSTGLKKTASALVKEAKLQPKVFQNEHDLLDVYQFYLTHKIKKAKVSTNLELDVVEKPSKKRSKISSSSSSSSSSDSEKEKTKKKVTTKKVTSSSSSSSSDLEEEKEKAQKVTSGCSKKDKIPKKTKMKTSVIEKAKLLSLDLNDASKGEKRTKKKRIEKPAVVKKQESSSLEDSSDSSDASSEEDTKNSKKTVRGSMKRIEAAADLSTSDSSDNSSDSSDEEKPKFNKRKAKTYAAEKNTKKAKPEVDSSSDDSSSSNDGSSDSSDSDSDSDTSDREKAQKEEALRREQAAKAALEWQPKEIEKVVTKTKSAGTPFQRVDGEFWSKKILDDTLRDNSYEGTFGIDGVGVKANNKLVKTRGKDFTKGKNKLKRSTYMCGAISMASNSFKFED